MKIVVNKCYGGFELPLEFCKKYDFRPFSDIERNDERLVRFVLERGSKIKIRGTDLRVIEIPDNATDWEIAEYDGLEEVIFVVNGKLCHI